MVFMVRNTTVQHLKCHFKSWELSLLLPIISYSSLIYKKGKWVKSTEPLHELCIVLCETDRAVPWSQADECCRHSHKEWFTTDASITGVKIPPQLLFGFGSWELCTSPWFITCGLWACMDTEYILSPFYLPSLTGCLWPETAGLF